MRLAGSDKRFLQLLGPSRRIDVQNTLNTIADPELDALARRINNEDPELGSLLNKLEGNIIAELAGRGFVNVDERLAKGNNKDKVNLTKAIAIQPEDPMESDLLEILSFRKGLDYARDPDMDREDLDMDNPLIRSLNNWIQANVSDTSLATIGASGVGLTGKRAKKVKETLMQQGATAEEAELQFQKMIDQTSNDAVVKFMGQNLMGNSLGEQPYSRKSSNKQQAGLPVEHMHTPFDVDPIQGLAVDNRDLGSRIKNSTIGKAPSDVAAQRLEKALTKLERYVVGSKKSQIKPDGEGLIPAFERKYGMSVQDAMDTYAMDYRPGQRLFPAI